MSEQFGLICQAPSPSKASVSDIPENHCIMAVTCYICCDPVTIFLFNIQQWPFLVSFLFSDGYWPFIYLTAFKKKKCHGFKQLHRQTENQICFGLCRATRTSIAKSILTAHSLRALLLHDAVFFPISLKSAIYSWIATIASQTTHKKKSLRNDILN